MTYILGISGRKGAGKDTLAAHLYYEQMRYFPGKRVRRMALIEPVKELLITLYHVPREIAYGGVEEKERPLHELGGLNVRDFCIDIATVLNRYNQRWKFTPMEKALPFCDILLITDVRFPFETDWIHAKEGKVIRLARNLYNSPDASESALDSSDLFDYVVPAEMDKRDTQLSVLAYLLSQEWPMAKIG